MRPLAAIHGVYITRLVELFLAESI